MVRRHIFNDVDEDVTPDVFEGGRSQNKDRVDEKNHTNCITKILISAWRAVGNLLLINVELDKYSQLFVVLCNASQLFDHDDSSHCIFLMFANIC